MSGDGRFAYYFDKYYIWGLLAFEGNDDTNEDIDFGYDEAMVKQIKSSTNRFFINIFNRCSAGPLLSTVIYI